jgi:hypothetical protein
MNTISSQAALLEYIKAENAKTLAWVNAAPGRGAGLISEDLEMWAKDGVFTVEDFMKYSLATNLYYNAKDSGYRLSWPNLMSHSLEELQAMMSEVDKRSQPETQDGDDHIPTYQELVDGVF